MAADTLYFKTNSISESHLLSAGELIDTIKEEVEYFTKAFGGQVQFRLSSKVYMMFSFMHNWVTDLSVTDRWWWQSPHSMYRDNGTLQVQPTTPIVVSLNVGA